MKALVYTLLLIISTHVLVLDAMHHEHDGGAAASLEQVQQDLASADVLDKVKLFVGCGCPEVLPVICQVFFFLLTFFIGEAHGALLAEWGIGQYIIKTYYSICHI